MCIPLILIASFFITWWKLIEVRISLSFAMKTFVSCVFNMLSASSQEERIKQVVLEVKNGMKMPVQCEPDKMTLADRIRAYWRCEYCNARFL